MQHIKSFLIGWEETNELCLSFNKVSWVNAICSQANFEEMRTGVESSKNKEILLLTWSWLLEFWSSWRMMLELETLAPYWRKKFSVFTNERIELVTTTTDQLHCRPFNFFHSDLPEVNLLNWSQKHIKVVSLLSFSSLRHLSSNK